MRLLLLLPLLLLACSRPVSPRTQIVSGTVESPGLVKVFVIEAGSADERIKLLQEARDHDFNLAKAIQAEARVKADLELKRVQPELDKLSTSFWSEFKEVARLRDIYIKNRQSLSLPYQLPKSYRMATPEFTAPALSSTPAPIPAGFAENQQKIEDLIKAAYSRMDALEKRQAEIEKAAGTIDPDLATPGDVATLEERLEQKPPAHLAYSTNRAFHFSLPANGRYELIALSKLDQWPAGTTTTNTLPISVTFTVWKLPAGEGMALTEKTAFLTEFLSYKIGGKIKPSQGGQN